MNTLPRTPDRQAFSPPAARASTRILVIGDDESTSAMLSNHLEAPGFDVQTAADDAEALTKIRQSPPELIVVDATTPGLSHANYPAWFRSEGVAHSTPIVALSTREGLSEVVARDGVWVCLVKPVQPERLVGAVERIANFCYSREAA
jgi:DNA-binding response OmpR family regulator